MASNTQYHPIELRSIGVVAIISAANRGDLNEKCWYCLPAKLPLVVSWVEGKRNTTHFGLRKPLTCRNKI